MKVVVMVCLACLCWTGAALAGAPKVVLRAEGVSGCPSEEELGRRIEAGLQGRSVAADEALHVVVEGQRSGGLVARVGWFRGEDALGEREIESVANECADLGAALVLVATTLFDEARDAPRSPQAEAPSEAELTAPPAAPAPPWVPQPPRDAGGLGAASARQAPDRLGSALLAGASVAVGVLSEASVGLRLDSRLMLRRQLSVWVAMQAVPWTSAHRVDEAQVDFAALIATAAACWSFPVSGGMEVDGCGGVSGGVMASRGSAIRGEPETVEPLVWPIGALALNAPIGSALVARAHVAAGPALIRNDYFVEDSIGTPRAVREAGPALCEGGLALGFFLP